MRQQLDILKQNIGQRKVFIWGVWELTNEIESILQTEDIEIAGYIDRAKTGTYYNKRKVYSKEILEGQKDSYYICLSVIYHQDIYDQLLEYGYKEIEDFFYFYSQIKLQEANYYNDIYGNVLTGSLKNVQVQFGGKSELTIGKNCYFGKNVTIILGSYAKLIIGSNCHIDDNITIIAGLKSTICFGDLCYIEKNAYIKSYTNSKLMIGNRNTFGRDLFISNEGDTTIETGADCMFSDFVKIRSGNGHGIYSLETEDNLSTISENFIKIDNHVWIGMGTTILNNSEIGSNSVIGAQALVKGKIESHCTALGVPAKVNRRHIDWRRDNISFEEYKKLNE